MTTTNFQFSPGAQLYVKHLDGVNAIRGSTSDDATRLYKEYGEVIKEMREEAYRSVEEFAGVFLQQLSSYPWTDDGLRLCSKSTYSVKSYAGARINYRWLEGVTETRKEERLKCDVGKIYFAFPVLEKAVQLNNDAKLQDAFGVFNALALNCLNVVIGYEGSDSQEKGRVLGIAKSEERVIFKEQRDDTCSIWIALRPEDPAGSAAETTRKLLRVLYEVTKLR